MEAKNKQKPVSTELVEEKRKLPPYLTGGIIFLAIVNLVFLLISFYLLGKMSTLALEHNKLRNNVLDRTSTEDLSVLEFELEQNRELSDRVDNAYPNETGLLEFINGVENFKTSGTVTKISFTSREPVQDGAGNPGIPVIIEFFGSWGAILHDMKEVQSLPYVFKPVKLETEKVTIDTDAESEVSEVEQVRATYGGFLYVDEEFSQNR